MDLKPSGIVGGVAALHIGWHRCAPFCSGFIGLDTSQVLLGEMCLAGNGPACDSGAALLRRTLSVGRDLGASASTCCLHRSVIKGAGARAAAAPWHSGGVCQAKAAWCIVTRWHHYKAGLCLPKTLCVFKTLLLWPSLCWQRLHWTAESSCDTWPWWQCSVIIIYCALGVVKAALDSQISCCICPLLCTLCK